MDAQMPPRALRPNWPPTRIVMLALSQLRGEKEPFIPLWNDSRIASFGQDSKAPYDALPRYLF